MGGAHSRMMTVLLISLVGFGPVCTDIYLPSMPGMTRALTASVSQVQMTLSGFLVGYAIAPLFLGPLSDRFGRRPVLLAFVALFIIASLLCSLATSIETLIAARMFQGVGAAGGPVLARAIVRDLFVPERGAKVLSYMTGALAAVAILAPFLGGWLEVAFGWRANFLAMLAFGIWVLALAFFSLQETNLARDLNGLAIGRLFSNFYDLIRNRVFIGHTCMSGGTIGLIFAWLSGSPFVIIDILQIQPPYYGLAQGVASGSYGLGALLAGRFVMRLGISRLLGVGAIASLALSALLLLLVLFATFQPGSVMSALVILGPVALITLSCGLVLPTGMAGAIGPFPHIAGAASSLIGFLQMGIGAIAGFLVGYFHDGSARPMAVGIAGFSVFIWLGYVLILQNGRLSPKA